MVPPFEPDDTDKEARHETQAPSHDEADEKGPRALPPPTDTGKKHETQNICGPDTFVERSLLAPAEEEMSAAIGPFGEY